MRYSAIGSAAGAVLLSFPAPTEQGKNVVFPVMKPWNNCIIIILLLISAATGYAQGPDVWVFGRKGGLNFASGQTIAASYDIESCYSPTSSQCDKNGNLLFYSDGRNIRDKNGQAMPGSANAVWPAPVPITTMILSNIVPVLSDTNRYYIFTLTPSTGTAPFGTYYSGALTYSIVDMRLNNGLGGIDPAVNNVLLNTDLDREMIVVPGKDCDYWLVVYRKEGQQGSFLAYRISEQGIAGPVYSPMNAPGVTYPYSNIKLVYAYQHHKLLVRMGPMAIYTHDFDPLTGTISTGNLLLELTEFRNQGGGTTNPALCLSSSEKMLYLLGYPRAGTGPNGPMVKLQQYPVDLAPTVPVAGTPAIIFQTNDALYQAPATQLPLAAQDCDIRRGPDGKVYLFYNTGMSFLGLINQPDHAGPACNFAPQGIQLLPNTFGSYYFPSIENKRQDITVNYVTHDTLLCFTEPITLGTSRNSTAYTFTWNDGSTGPGLKVDKAGTYWVRSVGTCTEPQQIDTFIVRFEGAEKCNCNIFIPNAFSPNKDNLNEVFKPSLPATCISGGYHLAVYNRWGAAVFHSYDMFKGWDGTIGAQAADLGVYHYTISYRDNRNNTVNRKGSFTLLR